MALLDGLEKVDWSRLHHAYGPAVDVPSLLRALVDPKATLPAKRMAKGDTFDQAVWILWGNVFHQGSVWQASAHVVPFLVEILRDGPRDDVRLPRFLLRYLHHLAMGYPTDLFPQAFDPDVEYAPFVGLKDPGTPPDFGDGGTNPGIWHRDCYEAVERATGDVARFFDVEDEPAALEAIALVTWFPRRREILVPPLLRTIEASRGIRRGTALVSLAHLAPREGREHSVAHVRSDEPVVALHAACARVISGVDRIDEDTLHQLLGTPAPNMESTLTNTVETLIARCLRMLPIEHQGAAVAALAKLLAKNTNPMVRLSLSGSLLGLLFPEAAAPQSARDLSPAARLGLEAIRDHGPFTLGNGSFANMSELMRSYRLPDSLVAFRAWLAVP